MWTMKRLQTFPQEMLQPQDPAFLPKLDPLGRHWPNSPVTVAMLVEAQGIAPKPAKPPLTCLQPMRMRRRSSFVLVSASPSPHLPTYLATLTAILHIFTTLLHPDCRSPGRFKSKTRQRCANFAHPPP